MQVTYWIFFGLVLKIPMIFLAVFVYRVFHEVPDEEIVEDGDGGAGVRFDQGPRQRGPSDGRRLNQHLERRGNVGHLDGRPVPDPSAPDAAEPAHVPPVHTAE